MAHPEAIEIFEYLSTNAISQSSLILQDNTAGLPLNGMVGCVMMNLQIHSTIKAWICNHILTHHALILDILVQEVPGLPKVAPWPV